MKIENSDKTQQLSQTPAKKTGSGNAPVEFIQVLKKTVQTQDSRSVAQPSIAPPIRPVALTAHLETTAKAARQTDDLLDTLETYQQMLAKPSIQLRKMQPVVEQLGKEADRMAASMNLLPQGHELQQIIKETLLQINQEIERFNKGVYI